MFFGKKAKKFAGAILGALMLGGVLTGCGGGSGSSSGGKDAAKLDEALAAAWGVLEGQVR